MGEESGLTRVTVVVPISGSGRLLARSVRSALTQTVEELEVLVAAGVTGMARGDLADAVGNDPRVRFLAASAGPEPEEADRDVLLAEARGEIVCYLSEGDLWLPNHVETMRRLLRESDLAHTLPVLVLPDRELATKAVDLSLPYYRRRLLAGEPDADVPLSCSAHTLALYRCLPPSRRAQPPAGPTARSPLHQLLARPECRVAGSAHPTALVFPSAPRSDWTVERRAAELDDWAARMADRELIYRVLDSVLRTRAARFAELHAAVTPRIERVTALAREADELRAELGREREEAARLRGELARFDEEFATLRGQADRLREQAARSRTPSRAGGRG